MNYEDFDMGNFSRDDASAICVALDYQKKRRTEEAFDLFRSGSPTAATRAFNKAAQLDVLWHRFSRILK